jgi:hypothetical protein
MGFTAALELHLPLFLLVMTWFDHVTVENQYSLALLI